MVSQAQYTYEQLAAQYPVGEVPVTKANSELCKLPESEIRVLNKRAIDLLTSKALVQAANVLSKNSGSDLSLKNLIEWLTKKVSGLDSMVSQLVSSSGVGQRYATLDQLSSMLKACERLFAPKDVVSVLTQLSQVVSKNTESIDSVRPLISRIPCKSVVTISAESLLAGGAFPILDACSSYRMLDRIAVKLNFTEEGTAYTVGSQKLTLAYSDDTTIKQIDATGFLDQEAVVIKKLESENAISKLAIKLIVDSGLLLGDSSINVYLWMLPAEID
jgi:hypothetical protein